MSNAIIVGGSRGIGFAVAKKFLKHSFNVTLVSRNRDNLIKSCKVLGQFAHDHGIVNAQVSYEMCDISEHDSVNETCQNLIVKHSPVDILVNSGGITLNKLLVSTKIEDIRRVLDTDLVGTILFTKLLTKQMIKQKSGSIVNIGSIIGQTGNAGQTIYSSAKAGLLGFSKSLAKELGPKNIRVNLISPGFIETDMTKSNMKENQLEEFIKNNIPLKRIGTTNDVANLVYFIATSTFITGSVVVIDGGLSLTF